MQTWWEISQSPDYQAWAHARPSGRTARLLRTLDEIRRLRGAVPADGGVACDVEDHRLDEIRQDPSPLGVGE